MMSLMATTRTSVIIGLFAAPLLLISTCGDGSITRAPQHFAVGVTTRQFVDATRSTPENQGVPSRPMRELPTEIWYPAVLVAGAAEEHDAPLDTRAAPYPLLFFVHGSSSFRRQSTFLTQALAAAGYVVAAADFPLTALATPGGPSDLHFDDQLGDLSFLANQLEEISRSGDDLLSGAIDPSGYGVIGHSTGGTVALLAAYAPDVHDARTRAAIARPRHSKPLGEDKPPSRQARPPRTPRPSTTSDRLPRSSSS